MSSERSLHVESSITSFSRRVEVASLQGKSVKRKEGRKGRGSMSVQVAGGTAGLLMTCFPLKKGK